MAAIGGDRVTGRLFATRSEVLARRGMAATSQPLATQVAIAILARGGSAVDAAIAANATLGLMEPTGCGVGGDLFALVWDSRGRKLHGLNASGRAPGRLSRDAIIAAGHDTMPRRGPLAVTVPGCVDGWHELHGRFGRLPMAEVLAPAIAYARAGFPVSEVIAAEWRRGAEAVADSPGFAATFSPGGAVPGKGDVFANDALATTLEAIAAGGRDAFYRGPIAERIDAFCRSHGCPLRGEDLAAHTSSWVEPVSTSYRGHEVWELPPNGQGIAALQMLNVLEGFDIARLGQASADHLHLLLEAKKLAWTDRDRYYADPEHTEVPVDRLIAKDYAAARRRQIDPERAMPMVAPGLEAAGDTVYLAVADQDRNMVSLIQSNYMGFGSGLCPAGLGFGLQNRGAGFTLQEGHGNVVAPGKRPLHTIIPAFVTGRGEPWLAFGVMGGDMQPQGHAQIVMNLLDFGANLQEAGDAARAYHGAGRVALESAIGAAVRAELRRRGHVVDDALTGVFGGYQAVAWDAERDVLIGASESRKDGQAAGI